VGIKAMIRATTSVLMLGTVLMAWIPSFEAQSADVSIKSYQHPGNEQFRLFNKLFFDGVTSGLIAYNVFAADQFHQTIFCIPGKLALTIEQTEDILDRYINNHHPSDTMSISIALLFALKETFPCPTR
jgi:hypothetical protein